VNAELLKRLFRAVSEGSDKGVRQVCGVIIDDVKKKHHKQLAKQLEEILATENDKRVVPFRSTRQPEVLAKELPQSRKVADNLISILSRQELEHFMVLPMSVEERFKRIEEEFSARDRLFNFGLKPRKKILLYGPPGCGKTLGAKRLAWTTGLKLVKVRFDVMVSSLFGETASNLMAIFDYCAENPSVLLLDECDFIARSRTNSRDIGEVQRIVNTLLQLMEDYTLPGLIVATTNLYEQLDPALFRRFDDSFEVPFPAREEIFKLLSMSFSTVRLGHEVDLQETSNELTGLSAADVVKIAQNAAKSAVLRGEDHVSLTQLKGAITDFSPPAR
jgi:SpoVK/Ycf46/Vps4 family AAA+-type ATPase